MALYYYSNSAARRDRPRAVLLECCVKAWARGSAAGALEFYDCETPRSLLRQDSAPGGGSLLSAAEIVERDRRSQVRRRPTGAMGRRKGRDAQCRHKAQGAVLTAAFRHRDFPDEHRAIDHWHYICC